MSLKLLLLYSNKCKEILTNLSNPGKKTNPEIQLWHPDTTGQPLSFKFKLLSYWSIFHEFLSYYANTLNLSLPVYISLTKGAFFCLENNTVRQSVTLSLTVRQSVTLCQIVSHTQSDSQSDSQIFPLSPRVKLPGSSWADAYWEYSHTGHCNIQTEEHAIVNGQK